MCAANVSTTMSNWSSTAGSNQPDSTDLASTLREDLQAIQAAVATVFPGMAGAAWRKQTKTGNYTLQATDNMSIISCTNASAATITAAAATVGAAFMCIIRNDSSAAGVLVIGTTKYFKGTAVLVTSDGTNITQIPINGGRTLLHFEELTTSTTVDVTGLDATTYAYYQLHMKNYNAGAVPVALSFLSGVGSIDTGANYAYTRHILNSAGTHFVDAGTGKSEILHGNLGTGTSNNLWANISIGEFCIFDISQFGADGTDFVHRHVGGIYDPASGTPDRIRIKLASSSFSGGQLFVWGVR